ncbi:MAG: hypothetical protein ACK56R_16070 [Pirellulaceae bacterium]
MSGKNVLRRPLPPGGVGYEESWLTPLALATIARWWMSGMYVVRRPLPPGDVGYEESWLTSSIATACGSHHRQMVDERDVRGP